MKRKERDVSFLLMSVSETQTTPLGIKSIELYRAAVLNTAVSLLGEEIGVCTQYQRPALRFQICTVIDQIMRKMLRIGGRYFSLLE